MGLCDGGKVDSPRGLLNLIYWISAGWDAACERLTIL